MKRVTQEVLNRGVMARVALRRRAPSFLRDSDIPEEQKPRKILVLHFPSLESARLWIRRNLRDDSPVNASVTLRVDVSDPEVARLVIDDD